MSEAPALSCSRCGAALPTAAAHAPVTCPYCGTTAAPVPRERIVERVVVVSGDGTRTAIVCARCRGTMHEARDGDVLLRGCRECGGVLIDRESLGALGQDDRRADRLLRQAVGFPCANMFGAMPNVRADVACPICGIVMRRSPVQNTRVAVDVCRDHGVWFDWGEINPYLRPPTDDPDREFSEDELASAGISFARSREHDGFFANLRRLLFGS
jgi:Zn-finger nucleic acid-binding protein/DNA-directed RNA polymerase subunit RPC12/RpoP